MGKLSAKKRMKRAGKWKPAPRTDGGHHGGGQTKLTPLRRPIRKLLRKLLRENG